MPETVPVQRLSPLRQWLTPRYDRLVLGLFTIYAVVAGVLRAHGRAFWYDELFTRAIIRQETTLAGLWNALTHCVDGNPPGFHLLEMLFYVPAADEHVALRMAPILGFVLTSVCLFFFVRRRCGPVSALFAAITPFLTQLFSFHAIDARPYTLTCGFLALALLAWQRSDRPWGAVCFPLSLAAAGSTHYYAVFALAPFLAAESVRWWLTCEIRFRIWFGLAVGALPIAVFWPLLSAYKTLFGAHYWAKPSLLNLFASYNDFPVLARMGTVPALLLALCLINYMTRAKRRALSIPLEEYAVALGFILLPIAGMIATGFTGGGMSPRYFIWHLLGISLACGYVAHHARRKPKLLGLMLLLCLFSWQESSLWEKTIREPGFGIDSPAETLQKMVRRHPEEDLPVVVSSAIAFVPIWHYADAWLAPRLTILLDPEQAVAHIGTDSMDYDLRALSAYVPMHAVDYRNFSAGHTRFLLYSTGDRFDWWLARLTEDGHEVRTLENSGRSVLSLVSLKPPATQARRQASVTNP